MSTWDDVDPTAIALLFIGCARLGDGELDGAELTRIVERVGQWMPGASEAELRATLDAAIQQFRAAPDTAARVALVDAAATRLAEVLVTSDRERVVTELIGLAYADGGVDVGETDYVLGVARAFGVEVALASN